LEGPAVTQRRPLMRFFALEYGAYLGRPDTRRIYFAAVWIKTVIVA
jgi:hypothetical protein